MIGVVPDDFDEDEVFEKLQERGKDIAAMGRPGSGSSTAAASDMVWAVVVQSKDHAFGDIVDLLPAASKL